MTTRENALAVLQNKPYERLPLVHFGYWNETVIKWAEQGHIPMDLARQWGDGNHADDEIAKIIGFDFNWHCMQGNNNGLKPGFQSKTVQTFPDGSSHVLRWDGVVELHKPGTQGIPQEISYLLEDRASWEELYLPKLQYDISRVHVKRLEEQKAQFLAGELTEDFPRGISIGSLYGNIRNWVGMINLSYLSVDDEELYAEIINTVGNLTTQILEEALSHVAYGQYDFGHYWEDICFRSGPICTPSVFAELVGPHYKKQTDLLRQAGIQLCSLDCDGKTDALTPIWLKNGVNVAFPMEVGVWDTSIETLRIACGQATDQSQVADPQSNGIILGVGGMDKKVFAYDFDAIDAEVERLKGLVALGGYLPCPDHRIAPDAKFENVQYYCKRMHETTFKGQQ
jgi:uroporphyrinogen decarboxylase